MRDVRAWSLWRKIYQSKEACRIMQRLTPRQARYFLEYMIDESKLVRDAVKRGGVMAILVTGGRLTLASVKRLEMFRDCKANDAVILLEAEPYFDDGVAADVKIEIVNLQSADVAQAAILEELPTSFGSDLAGGTTAIDVDAEIEAIDQLEGLARGDVNLDGFLERFK